MYAYLTYTMRPDGHQPLNNDSDRDDLKPRVLKAANKFDRPEWQWVATNGEQGIAPEKGPSLTYPWAGIHVMRNGWDKEADWSFFETGPYGTGHQHRDKLHVSVSAFGKDLLVDSGRYTHKDYFNFDPASWRGYFRSSYSHNVILVDGNGQKAGPVRAKDPLVEGIDYVHRPLYDYVHGKFEDGYENVEGNAVHSRSVMYVKNKYWVVLDYFETDRPRNIEVLWHYAPEYQPVVVGREVVSNDVGRPNLRIVPIGDVSWDVTMVKGQEQPVKQGWYSAVFGEKIPIATAVYTANIQKSTLFAWVLQPSKGVVPQIATQMKRVDEGVELTVTEENNHKIKVTLPVNADISKVTLNL